MVRFPKLPLRPLQHQRPTQHPRLQQLSDDWKVASHTQAQKLKFNKSVFSPPDSVVYFVCLLLWMSSVTPSSPSTLPPLYQLGLCIPFSAHLFSPKQPYVYSGSLEPAAGRVFRLAVGLISAAYLGPGQKCAHTHTCLRTQRHTRPRETAGCAASARGHLEEVKHKREISVTASFHASVAPHNSSRCSALLRLRTYVSPPKTIPANIINKSKINFSCLNDIICTSLSHFRRKLKVPSAPVLN